MRLAYAKWSLTRTNLVAMCRGDMERGEDQSDSLQAVSLRERRMERMCGETNSVWSLDVKGVGRILL